MARGCEEDTDISRLSSVRWQRRARTSDTSVRGGPRRHLRTRRAWTGDSLHAPYTCALETLFITQSLQVVIGDDICVDAERPGVAAGYRQVTLKWFGHVAPHDTSPKTVLQGYDEGGRPSGKQKKGWVARGSESMTMTM